MLFGSRKQPWETDAPPAFGGEPLQDIGSVKQKPNWLGIISDGLLAAAGREPIFMQHQMALKKQEEDRQGAMADREYKWQDWQRQEQWKRDNPAPINNDTVADYNFWKQTLPPAQFDEWLKNKVNPPQYRVGPDGQFYPINTTPSATPSFTDDDWNSGQPVGGAASTAPAPFANFPDPMKAPGHVTSGRRTAEGNALVGGKRNSHHLTGDAVDYTGTTPDALRAYFGAKARILPERNHNHVTLPGYGKVPYFGKRGTRGLRKN